MEEGEDGGRGRKEGKGETKEKNKSRKNPKINQTTRAQRAQIP